MNKPIQQLLCTLMLSLCLTFGFAQESVNASGGEASGSGGTVSYSVGQLVYTTATGSTGTAEQGVQHAFDVYAVGIEETIYSFSLLVYPNPTVDKLTLEVENFQAEQLSYQLFDLQGKLLQSKAIQTSQTSISFEGQAAGAYLLHINLENQPVQSFKILKN